MPSSLRPPPSALLLGSAQDGGIPHAGCRCSRCSRAWRDRAYRRLVCSLGLLDPDAGAWFLIDATPDFPEQLHLMQTFAPDARLSGIFITHAHIGHYTGLMHLGRESMNVRGMPLFGTRRLLDFLQSNAPWSALFEGGNLVEREITDAVEVSPTEALRVRPVSVPHRAEFSDTVGFIVEGPNRRLLYLPDIDSWDAWGQQLERIVGEVDVALLDGTFFDGSELPGASLASVPHPFVRITAERLANPGTDVRMIHFNHTNPLLDDGPERRWLYDRGLGIAEDGMRWEF